MSKPRLIVSVDFDKNYDPDEGVLRLEIIEGFGTQTVVLLDYPISDVNSSTPFVPELTPVSIRWGMGPTATRQFYGYVNHHEITQVPGGSTVRYFLVGTSTPMTEPRTGSWKKVTGSYIACQVAERNGLRAVVSKSDHVLPYWTQGSDGDFVMMQRLSAETGAQFWVDGSTLFFVDPQTLIRNNYNGTPKTFRMDGTPSDTLLWVKTAAGSLVPSSKGSNARLHKVFGIDASTGSVIQSSSTRVLQDKGLPVPPRSSIVAKSVNSLEEAQRAIEGALVGDQWVGLTALIAGSAEVRVGSLIDLEGDQLQVGLIGSWLVKEMRHVIETSQESNSNQWDFSTRCELSRNSTDNVVLTLRQKTREAARDVPAVLKRGRWESQVLESVYV